MALHMALQTTPGGPTNQIDMVGLGVAQIKLTLSYHHPAVLSFVMYQPQETFPLGINNFLIFWDDGGLDQNGAPFTPNNPTFEGFIDEVSPGNESNLVNITCYDPSAKAAKEIPIMSGPWQPGNPPTEGIGTVPRCIFNSSIFNDVDYAISRGEGLTCGNIIATMMDDATAPLRYWNACNPTLTPYDPNDLNDFTYVPNEKMAFESEQLRAGIESVLRWEPAVKIFWYPGARRWRFLNVYNAPGTTLTLNYFGGPLKVLSFNLQRSQQQRFTAVKIYGPEELIDQTVGTSDNSLSIIPSGQVLQTYEDANGTEQVPLVNQFQIADTTKRRMGRLLDNPIVVQDILGQVFETRQPTIEATWDGGLSWYAIPWWYLDYQNGIIALGNATPYETVTPPPNNGSNQTIFAPVAYRFTYPYYGTPISVRQPSSGFSGTAFTIANVETEYKIYDDQLAVGYNFFGVPVTTQQRLDAYEIIANKLLQQRQDLVHTGGATLDGMCYQFCRLYGAINIAAINGSGERVTTGWESIGAILTDVEYDYAESLTTLTFSSDQLALAGFDIDFLRHRLKIHALQFREAVSFSYDFTTRNVSTFGMGRGTVISGIHETITPYYVDPLNPRAPGQVVINPAAGAGQVRANPQFFVGPALDPNGNPI